MLLIFLSWIYILFSTVNTGFLLFKLLKINNDELPVVAFGGLFSITVIATLWAFCGRINYEFQLFLLLLNALALVLHKIEIAKIYYKALQRVRNFEKSLKILLLLVALLIVGQCACSPVLFDNDSYYIQTIKWLNQYGFVKGLANLHIFLGQMSGWHIAQSALNFNFLNIPFNDLSGFCLLLGNIFAIFRLDDYLRSGNRNALIIGLFPIANLLLLQFVGSPASDIPVYVLTFVIVFLFLQRSANLQNFNLIAILVFFTLLIKPTAIVLAIFPLILLLTGFRKIRPGLLPVFSTGILVLAIYIGKNMIISGHPFFPMTLPGFITTNYAVPEPVAQHYYTVTRLFGFRVSESEAAQMSIGNLLLHWLTLPKLHGFFNCLAILLALISPLMLWFRFNTRKHWAIYIAMCSQLLLLSISSPQYRFFLNFVLVFSFVGYAAIVTSRKLTIAAVFIPNLLAIYLLIVPYEVSDFTTNKFMASQSALKFSDLIMPSANSKLNVPHQTIRDGNLIYHSPIGLNYLYLTGNGKLPCVKKSQIRYYKRHFGVVPQLRTDKLEDGFYAKSVDDE